MSLRIYIAYGTAADQVTALRLQALGAVNGLTVYVPPAYTRQNPSGQLDSQSEQRLQEADIVLGLLPGDYPATCRYELAQSSVLGKKSLIISGTASALKAEEDYPDKVLKVDPARPGQIDSDLEKILKAASLEGDTNKAMWPLGQIATGLLLFAPQD